jgi:hypothetical protein
MKEFKIASIGMNAECIRFFQQLLKLYTSQLKGKWIYAGNFDPQHVVLTMGSEVNSDDILFIDVDNEHGRRAWYILEVLFDEHRMVALTSDPQYSGVQWSIQKSTLNWAAGQGKDVVNILNTVSALTG